MDTKLARQKLLLPVWLLLTAVGAVAQTNFVATNSTAGSTFMWGDGGAWTNEQATGFAPSPGGSNNYVLMFTGASSLSTNDLGAVDGSGFRLNQMGATLGTTNYGSNLVFMATDAGVGPSITDSGSGAFVIFNNLALSNSLTYTTAGVNADQLRGNLSGAGGLVKTGPGSLTLFGQDTYTGGTVISNGTLSITNGCWLNTPGATFNIMAGSNILWGGGAMTVQTLLVTNNTTTATNAYFIFNGSSVLTTSNANGLAANVQLASNTSWSVNGVWNMNAGTNITTSVQPYGTFSALYVGNGTKNAQVMVNTGAVWSLGSNLSGSTSNLNLIVGNGAAGSNNSVVVNNGLVTNVGYITIGNTSAGANYNSLIITNGGRVYNGVNNLNTGGATIGNSPGANSNFVIVAGANGAGLKALWDLGNSRLYIGGSANGSTGNWLRVDQGGVVTNGELMTYGLGTSLIVTNGGQFFDLNATAYIGRTDGVSNSVIVGGTDLAGNPALASFATLNIGGSATAGPTFSGTNNWVWVGQGGQLNATTIDVGGAGGDTNAVGNFMIVTNGGQVTSTATSYIGDPLAGNSNWVVVAGANGSTNAAWYLGAGSLILGNNASTGNWLQVGPGGVVTNNATLNIGNANGALGNFMIITNGGLVASGTGDIGNAAGANSNGVIVAGANGTTNATWNLGVNALNIGTGGANTGNWLQVNQGGLVTSTNTLAVGSGAGSFGDLLVVNNGWVTNFSLVAIGSSANSSFNQMIITNGGQVLAVAISGSTVAGSGTIGEVAGAFSNGVIVAGTNAGGVKATWNLGANRLIVGLQGSTGNWLRVDQGGLVTNAYFMTYGIGSYVVVTNGGQLYAYSSGNAFIGRTGAVSNSLTVAGTDGAGRPATFTALGGQPIIIGSSGASAGQTGTNNWLWVGQGGSVTAGGSIQVGGIPQYDAYALGNFMVITNGGLVKSSAGYIGADFGAISNWAFVGGANGATNAAWNLNANVLNIGYYTNAVGNSLTVGQGGLVSNVTTLTLGNGSALGSLGNFMIITNGGQLSSTGVGAIGGAAGASSNYAIIAGANGTTNATWNLGGNALNIGAAGATGNYLTVASGGMVTNLSTMTLLGNGSAFNLAGLASLRSVALNDATATLSLQDGSLLQAGASGNLVAGIGSNTLTGNTTWDTQAFNVTNALAILDGGGSGSLTKIGSGGLALSGANTYSGGTLIQNGTVALFGSGALGSGSISVASGATLDATALNSGLALGTGQTLTNSGTVAGGLILNSGALAIGGGNFAGAVTNLASGTLTPGGVGATNFFQALTLAGGSTNLFALGSAATHAMSVSTNGLTAADAGQPLLKLDLSAYTSTPNTTIALYDNLFSGMSAFNGTNQFFRLSDAGGPNNGLVLTNGATFLDVGGGSTTNIFTIHYDFNLDSDGNNNDIVLSVIPEPATLKLLLMFGAAGWLGYRRHRRGAAV